MIRNFIGAVVVAFLCLGGISCKDSNKSKENKPTYNPNNGATYIPPSSTYQNTSSGTLAGASYSSSGACPTLWNKVWSAITTFSPGRSSSSALPSYNLAKAVSLYLSMTMPERRRNASTSYILQVRLQEAALRIAGTHMGARTGAQQTEIWLAHWWGRDCHHRCSFFKSLL